MRSSLDKEGREEDTLEREGRKAGSLERGKAGSLEREGRVMSGDEGFESSPEGPEKQTRKIV